MWKLLSGIVLVVLLDLAFIWMMALEPDAPEIARAIGPTAAVPVIHEQPDVEPVAIDDSVDPEIEERDTSEFRAPRLNRHIVDTTERSAQPEGVTVSATAPQKLFEDTVIWIGRTEVPVKIGQREEAPIVSEPRQAETISASIAEPEAETKAIAKKKRSFQSKAFSVIKKPYDWMKAAVEKLD